MSVQTLAQRVPSPPSEVAGRPLIAGRFEVQAVLGEGGMGAVYRVRDGSSGSELALKRLRAQDKPKHVALFEREYYTLAGLKHPHIIDVYDYGRDADGPYYTMELLQGADIHGQAPLPWQQVCRVLRDVCSGLALIHARGLVHRDVSARNVWCSPTGHIKLIDFGALSAFGTTNDIAGTPPYLPPEALRGQPLDQRSDLYAIGALGYWLLTGLNAYPARSLAELPEAWTHSPRPASQRVRELERPDLRALPDELDALISALLTADPAGRPDTAAEVIDRLSAVAGLESGAAAPVIESHLSSKSFVGREKECAVASKLLARAGRGRGGSLCIEGHQGLGRTRLLAELALNARVSGVVVVETSAGLHDSVYGVALDLALKLIYALPGVAQTAAGPFAHNLGHLAPALQERLGVLPEQLAVMPATPGEARMRLQSALQDWFLAVARIRPLALIVDDVQTLDDASTAWLAGLAHQAKGQPLVIISGLRVEAHPRAGERSTDEGPTQGAALASLRLAARPVPLSPLTREQTSHLLGSVFGAVPNLARLVECLHRLSEGVPEHCMQLADHLVRTGVLWHVGGTWVLPQEIDETTLPASRDERLAASFERLSPTARELAQVLSIHGGLLRLDVCAALSELASPARFLALEELVREGVLAGSANGYRFRKGFVRSALRAELEPARARRAHRNLGELLLAEHELDAVERLQAGYHLLQGAEEPSRLDPRGAEVVAQAAVKLAVTDHASVGAAVGTLEASLGMFRAANAPKHELIALLCPLAIAGYYADRKLGLRYGDEAVTALERVLGLRVTRRVRPILGRTLGLYVGLIWAALGFGLRRKNPRVPSFRETITMLFNTVSTLAGASTICIDPDAGARFARVLEPLTALGENHAATVIYEFCSCLSGTVRDRLGQAYGRWQRLLARLDSDTPIRDLPDDVRLLYRAGGLYACGVMECWRDDSRALEFADRLDGFGLKLYEMSGDQLRMLYHANQGNLELAEVYRAKVELHAIQRGTAWQVETWTPGAMITVHLRTYDAMRLKQCMEQIERLRKDIPSLEVYARRAYGVYLLARGRHLPAIQTLEACLAEQPFAVVGWARMHGALARAHNAIGNYERAKVVCELALNRLHSEDLAFPAMNLIVQLEHAMAVAGLGEPEKARKALLRLISLHEASRGPLTLGGLHEALAKVESMLGDEAAAGRHYEAMERWYRGTKIASLVERCERVAWLRQAAVTQPPGPGSVSTADPQGLLTVVHRIRHGGETATSGAQWVLSQLAAYAAFEEGFVHLVDQGSLRLIAHIGEGLPGKDLLVWLDARVRATTQTESSVTAQVDGLAIGSDPNRTVIAGRHYRLATLRVSVGAAERVVGSLVLREEPGLTMSLPFDLLRAAASRLLEVTATEG